MGCEGNETRKRDESRAPRASREYPECHRPGLQPQIIARIARLRLRSRRDRPKLITNSILQIAQIRSEKSCVSHLYDSDAQHNVLVGISGKLPAAALGDRDLPYFFTDSQ